MKEILGDCSGKDECDETETFFINEVFVDDNRTTSVDSDLSVSLLQRLIADFL
ncbi:hypothetical protein H6G17_30755 [Chroococcidiopsis sp. FACHB-1243]|uniref:hypothetical protein n=1 Tax=Chroococcidiopsis sp. [FACHB-1243] TaxID=2692781 RepID=UPI0019BB1007|nr:hypothetical protein [Chroococcidiopsis sp. [FACHB-1243]]MBD2309795.1 hypothetical protein [Chroococcidiopsis sp. [FACHB-1243]]